jgi:hypothetical protein
MKRVALILFLTAIGCGKSSNTPESQDHSTPNTTAAPTTSGKPSDSEAITSIREYFTDPGMGWSNVEVMQVSAPVEAPKEAAPGMSELWAYSVTMTGENVIGEKVLNRNWLVLIGRENGKPKVKDCFNSLERVTASPLGKDWWAKSGLPEPVLD